MGLLALFVAGFIGGQSTLLLKIGIKDFPPLLFTCLRFIIATTVLLPFFILQKEKLKRPDIKQLSLQSIFFAGNVGIFSIASQHTGAIMSQILYTIVPLVVSVLSYFILNEKFTRHKIIGLIIAMGGIIFLIQQSASKMDILSLGTPLGNFLTLLAVLSWAVYMVLSKKLTRVYSPVTTSFVSYAITAFILLILVPIEQSVRPLILSHVTPLGVLSLFTIGIISSALMFFLIQFAIKRTSAFTASFFQYLGPLSAAITAIPFLGEKLTGGLIISGVLVIFGVFYATTYPYAKRGIRYMLK
ncbi:MAG: DMT family transporter [Candidatus Levybacteria bacterium]|nr:DMT family transporter [Candidatus Levybacteria bacterium]